MKNIETMDNANLERGGYKTIGGGLIIAGTSIGAGMLSIPLVSSGIGFGISTLIMFSLWALMTYTSLLMLEVHQHNDKTATLHTLSKYYLGDVGKYVATASMFLLFYSLCAAYTAGGGSNLVVRLDELTGVQIPASLGSIIVAGMVAALVAAGTHLVDKVNRVLFGLMMGAMILVIVFLTPNVAGSNLTAMPVAHGLILTSLPVVFTSFGFHGSIPAIVSYLDGDTGNLKKAMYIGSCLPLCVYILWLMCTLGVVHQDTLIQSSELGAMIAALSATLTNSKISIFIGIFADLALLTSFLGVSLGLFEYLRDTTQKSLKGNKVYVAVITYLPPLCFALFYPQGFIMALGYAAVALVVLAVFLPVAMVIQSRKVHTGPGHYRVRGGLIPMYVSVAFGALIILSQFFAS